VWNNLPRKSPAKPPFWAFGAHPETSRRALVYHFHWDEFVDFNSALYFSLASFTTLGATDLALPPEHRMIGALEAAAGMLMFGWSTALLVGVVQRTDHRPRP
jgi:hypothetical protein